jgi:putative phosphoesterase
MRILVMSDAHGQIRGAEKALEAHPDAKQVFYLGDGSDKIHELKSFYPDRNINIVSGNCDFNSNFMSRGEAVVNGIRILYTHGHRYNVKYGIQLLYDEAKTIGAKLVLYGHTHVSKIEYIDGIYFVNPGALSRSRDGHESYAVIDITDKGIMPIIIKS